MFLLGHGRHHLLCLASLETGDHIVVSNVIYGGTVRLVREVLGPPGINATFVDATDPRAVRAALERRTPLILLETRANPALVLTDIAAVADVARQASVRLAVDNTFLTPVLQRPLDLGEDITIYSTTKYIEGQNATVGGAGRGADGGMVCCEPCGGAMAVRDMLEAVELCSLAENLEAVESLITHPASMTHPDAPAERRAACGLSEDLVRLSVGLEDVEDIIADLDHALSRGDRGAP